MVRDLSVSGGVGPSPSGRRFLPLRGVLKAPGEGWSLLGEGGVPPPFPSAPPPRGRSSIETLSAMGSHPVAAGKLSRSFIPSVPGKDSPHAAPSRKAEGSLLSGERLLVTPAPPPPRQGKEGYSDFFLKKSLQWQNP